jgi:hypothetical protein
VRQRPNGALEFDDTTPAAGLGDVVGRVSWRSALADGTRLGADLAVKAPTGDADNYRGSGSWDAGLLLGAEHRFFASRRLGLHLEVGVVDPGRFRGDTPTTIQHVGVFSRILLGADVKVGKKRWLSVSIVREESPYRRDPVGDGSRPSVEVMVGVVRDVTSHARASLSLTENLPPFGDAPDIAAFVGLTVR